MTRLEPSATGARDADEIALALLLRAVAHQALVELLDARRRYAEALEALRRDLDTAPRHVASRVSRP